MNSNQREYKSGAQLMSSRELRAQPYPCLIPEGEYLAIASRVYRDDQSRTFGPRIYVYFCIFDGEYSGKEMRMYLRPSVYPTSNYYRAWAIANGGPPRSRGTKISPRMFLGKLFRVRVATVRPRQRIIGSDGKARPGDVLPDHLWYSKIACLCSLEVTNSSICDLPSNGNGATPSPVTHTQNKPFRHNAVHRERLGEGSWELGIGCSTRYFQEGVNKSANALQPVGDDEVAVADHTPILTAQGATADHGEASHQLVQTGESNSEETPQ